MKTKGTLKICAKGHQYYKSSDCPTCPTCEAEHKPKEGLLSKLSAPAGRALERLGIKTAEDLAKHSQKEIMSLHGMGPSSLPKLKAALEEAGLTFKN